MGITPLAFTGISKFSEDFQTIVNRTVAIASLPVKRLQTDQANLLGRKGLMGDLRSAVANLASSLSSLGATAGAKAATASSNSTKVSVSVNGSPQVANYTISEVTSLASSASATSRFGYATKTSTPVAGVDHTIDLVVNGVRQTLTLTESTNNLQGLADAINAGDSGLRASIIDTGSGASRYYMVLSATASGPTAISLQSTGGEPDPELMSQTSPGSNAQFKINGQPVTSATNTLTSVVDGLSLTLNETTGAGETITIAVNPSRNTLSAGLKSLVATYNSLRTKLDAQSGDGAGLLLGDRMVIEIQARMRMLVGASGPDGTGSLSQVGLTLDAAGRMAFDEATIAWMSDSELDRAFRFLGEGENALGSFAAQLESLSDPIFGTIAYELQSYDETDRRLTKQIDLLSERVQATQATLFARLQAADALLAQIEGQQSIIEASVKSLNLMLFGKQNG